MFLMIKNDTLKMDLKKICYGSLNCILNTFRSHLGLDHDMELFHSQMQQLADVARTFPVTSENQKNMDATNRLESSARWQQQSLHDE